MYNIAWSSIILYILNIYVCINICIYSQFWKEKEKKAVCEKSTSELLQR